MAAAADITAAIINITSIGGDVGARPKTNTKTANPRPPITPSPMPPMRAPTKMAIIIIENCKNSIFTRFVC